MLIPVKHIDTRPNSGETRRAGEPRAIIGAGMDSDTGDKAQLPVAAAIDAGTQMRMARENAALTLAEVASRTRVPLRHLEALERGAYGELPGITYCAGFARAYARAVGLDEKALTAKVRAEIEHTGEFAADPFQIEEATDPARVPPRFLAWTAAIIAVLIAGSYSVWRMQVNAPPSTEAEVTNVAQPVVVPRVAPPAPAPVAGPVVLSATADVWLKIYDVDGKSLFQNTLLKGQAYTVPADAKGPMIVTGRPDALTVTVGGRAVPPLGTGQRTIADVPVSATELLKRTNAVVSAAIPSAPASSDPAPSDSARPATQEQRTGTSSTTSSARKPVTGNQPTKARPAEPKPSGTNSSAPNGTPANPPAADTAPAPLVAPGPRVSVPTPPSGQ